jgi:hypothetical protein
MLAKLKAVVDSRYFFWAAVLLFGLQSLFLAIVVPYKVPSDEEYHFRFTQIYAHRSVWAGPIIAKQTDNFDIGDIQRPPGYLYHYLSSFLLRSIEPVVHSQDRQLLVLRLVNVGLGVWALLLVVALLRRLGARGVTVNLTVAWLALTTMFVWVFAALNYDNLSIVLFFILLHLLLDLYKKMDSTKLLWSGTVALGLLLTKETYAPTVLICYVLLLMWWIKQYSFSGMLGRFWQSVMSKWQAPRSRWLLIGAIIATLLFCGLFLERYGQNYLRYKKTTPNCSQVHTESECLQNSIYRRNTGQRQEYVVYKNNGGKPSMTVWQYTTMWVRLIYERTYFFRGQASTNPTWQARLMAQITTPILLVLAAYGWRKRRYGTYEKALGFLTVVYIILVFLYNLNTYIYYGYPFAIQGRYILPVLPFVYYFVVAAVHASYRRFKPWLKYTMVTVMAILLILNFLFHSPMMIYRHKGKLLVPATSFISRYLS